MMKKKSTHYRLIIFLGLGLLLLLALVLIARSFGWLPTKTAEIEVDIQTAELRTITQQVSASGRIQPELEVIIRPDVSGEIIELNVKEGDFVRQGDLLLRIKPDIYQAQIDDLNAVLLTQMARMEQARANKLQSESEYLRQKQLYERNMISELEYLQASNAYKAQQANFRASEYQIESARAQLRRAEEELQQTVIRSPKDGTISRLAVERGERVLGQAQTAGTEMMRIARLEQMELVVDVNENDIVNVNLGNEANIQVDAYPNRSFEGVVTEIANSADVTGTGSAEQITNYKVKIRITTPHNITDSAGELMRETTAETTAAVFYPNFKPGMSGTVDIKTRTVTNVVAVPIQAVTVRDFARDKKENDETDSDDSQQNSQTIGSREDFRRVIFVNEDGIARRVEVETGISDNSFIEVIHGLDAGQEVVTGSYRILSRELKDGDAIKASTRGQIAARSGN
jgi:HlyD family secretion protein